MGYPNPVGNRGHTGSQLVAKSPVARDGIGYLRLFRRAWHRVVSV